MRNGTLRWKHLGVFFLKKCSIDGCDYSHLARGFCKIHYGKARRSGAITRKISINVGNKCLVDGCSSDAKAVGMCIAHYERKKKYGDPLASAPKKTGGECSHEGCHSIVTARGMCRTHYARLVRHGSSNGFSDWYKKRETQIIDSSGYALTYDPKHPNAKKSGRILEHRRVMSQKIGRPLQSGENVHHINGNRSDNRIENLELWKSSQPAGQRVQDLVRYAISIIDQEFDAAIALDPSLRGELLALARSLKML